MREKPTFAVRLETDLKEALDKTAADFGVTTAQLVRAVLRRYVGIPNKLEEIVAVRHVQVQAGAQ